MPGAPGAVRSRRTARARGPRCWLSGWSCLLLVGITRALWRGSACRQLRAADPLLLRLKCGHRLAPHLVQVGVNGLYAVRLDLVDAPGPVRTVGHQPCVLEHAQVLGHGRTADRQLGGELADRFGPAG